MLKSEAERAFGVIPKLYVAARREGRPLAQKKHLGSKPKLGERARKLLEADVEDRNGTVADHQVYAVSLFAPQD